MAEIVAGFAGAATEVAKLVAQPIKRQFNYLCCFTSNIDGLKREAEELDNATREVQGRVDRETENLRVIVPEVSNWFDSCRWIKEQKETILDEAPNVKQGCLKLRARFSLSRRAKKAIDRMKELRGQKNFDHIATEGPPAATREIPLGRAYEFESRKKIEQDIITTLRDDEDVNIVGICGMGGLGKTTMAQRIMNRVLKDVFEEVVMVVVSQRVDKFGIQVEIGKSLGLHLQHDSAQARVQKLHARLSDTKRILLILDDVWEGLELQGLGIPCDSKQCKVLVTSRNEDALSEMDVQKVFGMEVLPPDDAWFLFKERAGTCVDDAKLKPIAKEVVDKCGGLPIALTAVGTSLKQEKDACIWKDALRQLRKCDQDIPSFIEKVYNPLKLSYDFLRSQQAKSLILLCCLFPEDARIPLDNLTYCCIGLDIFECTLNMEGARNKVRALAKMLKSRSLLLDCWSEDEVRMHDVVRDVIRIIAKQEGYVGGNDRAWMSSSELMGERASELRFPNLHLLLLTQSSRFEEEFRFDEVFLEEIRDLHVLWIEYFSLTSLPRGTQPFRNLNTLVLSSCSGLKTISTVGELVSLEILISRHCHSLEELPPEMKGLNRLKLLDLTGCYMLQSIGRGIIASLVGLEELKMLESFHKWEAEDRKERENASLRELQALTNLTCLEIQIENHALVAENMQISTKLERFCIRFHTDFPLLHEFYDCDKKMNLRLERDTYLGYWIAMQLLRETESLSLWGNGATNVDLSRSENIKWLKLSECEAVKNVVTTCSYDDADAIVFPASLEHMRLDSLPQLQEVSIPFHNISSITITDCPNLAKLSIASDKDCFTQLEKLRIEGCEMMEQVFLSKSRVTQTFPKLKEVKLGSLPNLVTFCQGIQGIEFPLLREIRIEKCPKWTTMVSCNGIDEYSSPFFCQLQKVSSSYGGLTKLIISNYHGSRSLLSSSIASNLANLMRLHVKECDEIVHVIEDDEEEGETTLANGNGGERAAAAALFPKLDELCLYKLPKLLSFSDWKRNVELPSLRSATIMRCPNMKNMSLGFLSAPISDILLTDFNHQLELGVNVSFDRLKALCIEEVRNVEYPPFYHHEFFISLVDGLEELSLFGHGSMNLFSCSIAGKLVNLKFLRISDCNEVTKVIEDDDTVVAPFLPFPKLEVLHLEGLPKLESFCESRKFAVELSSLRQVSILRCPSMKSFSRGDLNAPKLEFVHIDEHFGG